MSDSYSSAAPDPVYGKSFWKKVEQFYGQYNPEKLRQNKDFMKGVKLGYEGTATLLVAAAVY